MQSAWGAYCIMYKAATHNDNITKEGHFLFINNTKISLRLVRQYKNCESADRRTLTSVTVAPSQKEPLFLNIYYNISYNKANLREDATEV